MITSIQSAMPFLVVASHIGLVILFVSLLLKNDFAKWVGEHALTLGLFTAVAAVVGSLFYSNGVGFEPCYLCWWQRVAIYPMLVLFGVALMGKDREVFKYVLPLSVVGFVLATYHSYVQWGGNPLIPCDATASCTKLYVDVFGYITIPTMSLTIVVTFLLLYWSNKIHENRHA